MAWGIHRTREQHETLLEAGSAAFGGTFTCSSRKKSPVEDPFYQVMNLAENNIYLRFTSEEFQADIAKLVNHTHQDCDSPGPSLDQLKQNTRLERLEAGAGNLR